MTGTEARTVMVDIRPLAATEVKILEQALAYGYPAKHAVRFAHQQQGNAVYLVAWQRDRPVGHVLLEWAGCSREPMRSALSACPMASDLRVVDDLQSHGIGSQLLSAVDQQARAAGYTRVGLAVAVDNVRARVLYERRGYRDAGFTPYVNHWKETDEHGAESWMEERDVYLVRELSAV